MGRFGAAFNRLSKREKKLIGSMVGILVLAVIVIAQVAIASSVSKLEKKVDEDREKLSLIYQRSAEYQKATAKDMKTKNIAIANREKTESLTTLIETIANQVSFDGISTTRVPEGKKRLGKAVQFEPVVEQYLSRVKRRAGRKKPKKTSIGYYQRELKLRTTALVPFDALYQFLEKIETDKEHPLLFVTNITMNSRWGPERVAQKNAEFTISTYYYKDTE